MKLSNECFMCRNRFCSNGIISCDDNGEAFNEIACAKHTDDLYAKANEVLGDKNGAKRLHISSSSVLTRKKMVQFLAEVE